MGKKASLFMSSWIVFALGASATCAIAGADPSSYGAAVAVYTVPVPPELKPYAQFTLTQATYGLMNGEVQLSYALPPELVGDTATVVTLSGAFATGGMRLSGPLGTASCLEEQSQLACVVDLSLLHLPAHAADSYLQGHYSDPNELAAREQVAAEFGEGPIGIVTYPLAPAGH